MAKGLSLLQHLIGGSHFQSIFAEVPSLSEFKTNISTYLRGLGSANVIQWNIKSYIFQVLSF